MGVSVPDIVYIPATLGAPAFLGIPATPATLGAPAFLGILVTAADVIATRAHPIGTGVVIILTLPVGLIRVFGNHANNAIPSH